MRWLYLLLLAIPAALIAEAIRGSSLVIFLLAALGLIPLAGLIGLCTETLAKRPTLPILSLVCAPILKIGSR